MHGSWFHAQQANPHLIPYGYSFDGRFVTERPVDDGHGYPAMLVWIPSPELEEDTETGSLWSTSMSGRSLLNLLIRYVSFQRTVDVVVDSTPTTSVLDVVHRLEFSAGRVS